jgi:hypothetical protein
MAMPPRPVPVGRQAILPVVAGKASFSGLPLWPPVCPAQVATVDRRPTAKDRAITGGGAGCRCLPSNRRKWPLLRGKGGSLGRDVTAAVGRASDRAQRLLLV